MNPNTEYVGRVARHYYSIGSLLGLAVEVKGITSPFTQYLPCLFQFFTLTRQKHRIDGFSVFHLTGQSIAGLLTVFPFSLFPGQKHLPHIVFYCLIFPGNLFSFNRYYPEQTLCPNIVGVTDNFPVLVSKEVVRRCHGKSLVVQFTSMLPTRNRGDK